MGESDGRSSFGILADELQRRKHVDPFQAYRNMHADEFATHLEAHRLARNVEAVEHMKEYLRKEAPPHQYEQVRIILELRGLDKPVPEGLQQGLNFTELGFYSP